MRSSLQMLVRLFVVALSLFPLFAHAQSVPDFVFEVRTNSGSSGPFTAWTVVPASWSHDYDSNVNGITREWGFSGSASTNSASFSSYSEQGGTGTLGGVQSNFPALYSVKVWVKGPASTVITAATNASVSINGYVSDPWSAVYSSIPFSQPDLLVESMGGSANDSDSYNSSTQQGPFLNCGTSASWKEFSQYPGTTYYLTNTLTFGSISVVQSTINALASAQGTTSITASRGADEPVGIIDGPYVSGQPVVDPELGDAVTFYNESYDPDNQQGTTALAGICLATWSVTYPDGWVNNYSSQSNPGNLESIAFTANRSGKYTVQLTVTDNEGDTKVTTTSFVVAPREPSPGAVSNSCSGAQEPVAGISLGRGNASIMVPDPVRTRGYPLRNNLYINSQTHDTTRTTLFGNASFSYGIEVREMPVRTSQGTFVDHWFVVDGDGQEIDFGPSSSAPSAGDGVFSVLTQTQSGFTLTGAGAPEQVETAGNYSYTFDSNGKLLDLTDPQGNEQTLTYNQSGELTLVTDVASDKTIEFEYDSPGFVARIIQNGGGAVTHIGYTNGLLSSITLKDAQNTTIRSAAITYNAQNLPATFTKDGDSATTLTFSYVDGGHGVYLANISSSSGGTNYAYGLTPAAGAKYRVSQTNAKGGIYYFDFDEKQDLKTVTFPTVYGATQTVTHTYTYNSDHLLTSFSDGAVTHTFTYATNGKLTRIEDSAGNFRQWTYSGANLTKIEDNIGTLVDIGYTDSNHPNVPTTFTDAGSNTWTRVLNQYGQVTQIQPPTGSPQGTTYFTYDETSSSPTYGYLTSITNGAGDVISIDGYSLLGDITSFTTYPDGSTSNTSTMSYDPAHRVTGETNPDSTTKDYQYTGKDLTQFTDEAGTQTTYEYCPTCSAMTEMHEPLSRSLFWDIDGDYDLSQFTDGRGNNSTYTYDSAGNLKFLSTADGAQMTYSYDNQGRFKKFKRWGSADWVTLTYNSAGRVTQENYSPNSSSTKNFTYKTDGTLATHSGASDFPLNATYTYTPERLIASVSYNYSSRNLSNVQKLEYTYNPDQTRATMTWKNGAATVATWTYSYDGAGRLSSVTNSFGESISYTYDGEGKIATQTNGNGTTVDYTYNEDRNWPTIIDHKLSGTSFAKYTLTYDGGNNTVGNLTGVTELSGDTMTYGYDALYRLTSETRTGSNAYSTTYGYDLEGNITTLNGNSFASYDSGNKFSSITSGAYAYVTTNLTSVSGPGISSGGFGYGGAGDLTGQNVSGANGTSYRYDGLGRRVYSTGPRYYIYDGDKLVGELLSGTANIAYTWGADGLVSERLIPSNKSLYYHFGPQGETRQLTNSSGTVVDTYLYNAYGKTIATTGTDTNHHRYGGKYGYYTDGANGIILAGLRWYHPAIMRWLTRDPIQYEGGTNMYAYVGGNPVRYVDPTGLLRECPLTEEECRKDLKNWQPYHGGRFGACIFHCCGQGYLENRIPTPEDPQGECFYDEKGDLIRNRCGGTPNQFDSKRDWWNHTVNDRGGIVESGFPAFWESTKHQIRRLLP